MANTSIEERLNKLELVNEELKHRLERSEAVNEIQKVMSRYEYLITAGQVDKMAELFAEKTPGVRVEYGSMGVFEGKEGARRYLDFAEHFGIEPGTRKLAVHALTTPMIEVAGDGNTARALWISLGTQCRTLNGKWLHSQFLEEYDCDFVKEDGVWKFWRLHLYLVFSTPYGKSLADITEADLGSVPSRPSKWQPDRPPTYYIKRYVKTRGCDMMDGIPAPPEPYETWDDSMASVK